MELYFSSLRSQFFRFFSYRASELSKTINRVRALKNSRALRLSLTATLTLLFAVLAHESSQHSALESWKNEHAPSEVLLKALLQTKRFQECGDSKKMSYIQKTLASQKLDARTLFIDSTFHYVAWVSDTESNPLFFCQEEQKETPKAPLQWASLGQGWNGFDRLIRGWDQIPKPKTQAVKSSKQPERDPREIQY